MRNFLRRLVLVRHLFADELKDVGACIKSNLIECHFDLIIDIAQNDKITRDLLLYVHQNTYNDIPLINLERNNKVISNITDKAKYVIKFNKKNAFIDSDDFFNVDLMIKIIRLDYKKILLVGYDKLLLKIMRERVNRYRHVDTYFDTCSDINIGPQITLYQLAHYYHKLRGIDKELRYHEIFHKVETVNKNKILEATIFLSCFTNM
jgi:predicted alpha-1,6-mannanase (GH76 family)